MTKALNKHNEKNHAEQTGDIDFSILLRTKNEQDYIGRILDAFQSQTYKNYEVIIVDSGSTDRTLEIAEKYPVRIYRINPEDFTYGFSLNYGFERARGKYVVCLSGHALPQSRDWLSSIISNFNDEKVAAVMCKTIPWPDCNPFDRRGLLKKYNNHRREITEGPPFIFSNSSSVIRKDIWKRIHFDETLSYSEDVDWARKVGALNYKIIYEPDAKVYHSHNESLKQIYRRFYRESHALKTLNCKKYSILEIFYDLVAGSIYDMIYVLVKRDHIKWFFFAPLRRFAMNYARFRSNIDKNDSAIHRFISKLFNFI